MITKPLVHEVVRHTIIPAIPSISQFASSVATKCLSFGVPCAIGVAASSFGPNTNRALGTPRGGGSSSNLDLERVGLRLSSLAEYCVISSLILGAIIDIYSDTPKEDEQSTRVERVAQSIHGVCVCLGFMSAVYTTVVFSLFGLYAKTALGTGDDTGYMTLLSATQSVRLRGFQSFIVCLLSFNTSFIMNLFLTYRGITRWIICVLAITGTGMSMNSYRFIMEKASQIIFR